MEVKDKTVLITGGTNGLGAAVLSRLGSKNVYFTGRSAIKAEGVIEEIKKEIPDITLTFIEMDLADLKSVEAAAKTFLSMSSRLDTLVCNAGVMSVPAGLTKDGYEIVFGTNHLGHALLIKLLLPTLLQTAGEPNSDVRIVLLSSVGYLLHPLKGIDFDSIRTKQESLIGGTYLRYGQSKLANILYGQELAQKYPTIKTVSIHPGVIETGLGANLSFFNKAFAYVTSNHMMISMDEGIENHIWASTAPRESLESGKFYEPVGKPGRMTRGATDRELAEKLWNWTQEELKSYNL
ncbi:short-chain dehydrogenase reductase family [Dipodascopsis uninucleata]